MSAYGAVVSVLLTLDILDDHPGEHLAISLDRRQLELLREKFSFLQEYFLQYPFRKIKAYQKAEENLEARIGYAAFTAQSIIDAHLYNLLSKPFYEVPVQSARHLVIYYIALVVSTLLVVLAQVLFRSPISVLMPALLPWVEAWFMDGLVFLILLLSATLQYVRHYWDAKVLLQILKEVGSITDEVVKMKNEYGSVDLGPTQHLLPAASPSRGDSAVSGEIVVVGFENDLAEIKTRLCSNSHNIEIVPIVGMGGIGKTTLVRQVHNDGYIKDRFDIRAWATVSQEYSLRQVLRVLLDSAEEVMEEMSEMDEEELGLHLHRSLIARRYLIVIDDIWDVAIWDAVRRFFPEDNNGSRVLLTTRLSEVALYANSGGTLHRMRFLNQDESWDLLNNRVFGEKRCPNELEELGKDIARNCGGLPLAIVVTGGLLSKVSRTEECWRIVAENLNLVITNYDEQCMGILCLSYDNLPHCLRPCFLYMGVFPEDYEIPVSKLIRLWAAEGFLRSDRFQCLEELAEEYLEDLIERNLANHSLREEG